jgi:hypothetical protein
LEQQYAFNSDKIVRQIWYAANNALPKVRAGH